MGNFTQDELAELVELSKADKIVDKKVGICWRTGRHQNIPMQFLEAVVVMNESGQDTEILVRGQDSNATRVFSSLHEIRNKLKFNKINVDTQS